MSDNRLVPWHRHETPPSVIKKTSIFAGSKIELRSAGARCTILPTFDLPDRPAIVPSFELFRRYHKFRRAYASFAKLKISANSPLLMPNSSSGRTRGRICFGSSRHSLWRNLRANFITKTRMCTCMSCMYYRARLSERSVTDESKTMSLLVLAQNVLSAERSRSSATRSSRPAESVA